MHLCRKKFRRTILLLTLLWLLFGIRTGISPVQNALAADQVVTNLNDIGLGSLRQALAAVGDGETITFQAGLTGTITLTAGELTIDKSLTITGPGANVIKISGTSPNRVINITNTAAVVNISGLTIANGDFTGPGGGIRDRSTGNTNLTDITFTNNTASTEGGALNAESPQTTTLTRVTFSGNTASDDGGAIAHRNGDLVINECTFSNNTATGNTGGAFYNNADAGARSVTVDKSTFLENGADSGGAIRNQINLTITNSTFSKNTAETQGGAILDSHFDSVFSTHITNSTFSGNRSKENGGAISYLSNGDLSLNNVTITDNTADSDDNGSGNGGGFFEIEFGGGATTATFQNTILSGNTDEGNEAPNCSGDAAGDHLNSQNYNLIQDTTGCTIGGNTADNITGLDANLAALADNGGETETHALNNGSPAIDKGNNVTGCTDHNNAVLTIDQRGETRPFNGRCDIGAFEYHSIVESISTGGNDNTKPCGNSCSVGSAGKYCTFCSGVAIRVPANTVQDGSRVIVNEIIGSGSGGNLQLGNSIYDIKIYGPDGQLVTTFDPPLEVCIKPTNATLSAAGWNFDNLTMFHSHAGGAWTTLTNTYESNGKLCASIWQLSLFTITALEMPATGFPPNRMTILPSQPPEKSYSLFDDLTLEISSLDLSMPIVGIPLDLNGWDVSWLGDNAGYLEGTAFPTWAGNTAITAHVWNSDNTPGPFIDLHTLLQGDEIVIHAWDLAYTYEVVDVQQVNPENIAALSQENLDVLTLFTCQGFNEITNHYNWRIAVRAILVDVKTE